MSETLAYFSNLPLFELIAMITALIYVILAAKGNIYCWPAALISTLLYTVIFYDVYLWMDSVLQIYYMGMALYGWYCWQQVKTDQQAQPNMVDSTQHSSNFTKATKSMLIQQWSMKTHIKVIVSLTIFSLLLGWFMANYTPTDFPYVDSATTVFAIFATYLVTQKVLENWLYWLVIDFVSIYIYLQKGLTPTAVLFALYVVLAVYGYLQWAKMLKAQAEFTTEPELYTVVE
jgi:nicotinamide mononucleotide transporter